MPLQRPAEWPKILEIVLTMELPVGLVIYLLRTLATEKDLWHCFQGPDIVYLTQMIEQCLKIEKSETATMEPALR